MHGYRMPTLTQNGKQLKVSIWVGVEECEATELRRRQSRRLVRVIGCLEDGTSSIGRRPF
jgi:hypothetical protein